jgi:hypothetical protein
MIQSSLGTKKDLAGSHINESHERRSQLPLDEYRGVTPLPFVHHDPNRLDRFSQI